MPQRDGKGLPEDANARYRRLIASGTSALTVAFDRATRLGLDPDDTRAAGCVAAGGVSVATIDDMDRLLDGVDPGRTMIVLDGGAGTLAVFGLYLAATSRKGTPFASLRGALHHDLGGDEDTRRLMADVTKFCVTDVPAWRPLVVRGDDAPGTGATELAVVLATALDRVERCTTAGLSVAEVTRRLTVVLGLGRDFFEDIARLRAVRRLWASLLRERFGQHGAAAMEWQLEVHTVSAIDSLEDVVRTSLQGLSAVLGGAQAIDTGASVHEPGSVADAAMLALRAQQVLAHESGVGVEDPLAGSYFVEALTADIEREVREALVARQRDGIAIDGVGFFPDNQSSSREGSEDGPGAETQRDRLRALRLQRNAGAVAGALTAVRAAAGSASGIVPAICAAAQAYATVGEISRALRRA